jgi:hypothetical protein
MDFRDGRRDNNNGSSRGQLERSVFFMYYTTDRCKVCHDAENDLRGSGQWQLFVGYTQHCWQMHFFNCNSVFTLVELIICSGVLQTARKTRAVFF